LAGNEFKLLTQVFVCVQFISDSAVKWRNYQSSENKTSKNTGFLQGQMENDISCKWWRIVESLWWL